MASERRNTHRFAGSSVLAGALLVAACSGAERRFPLRDPLWQDTDQRPVSVDCEPRPTDKDQQHRTCAPDPYVSPLVWDAADNSIFRPFAQLWAVDPGRPAPNVNAFDEVPDSAWFTNRLGKKKPTRTELLQGACSDTDLLDGATAAAGSWVIDQGKPNGATPGFRIKVGGKYKFLLKTDNKTEPERPTAASAIGAALYHAVGFNTSCEQIVYFDPSVLSLKPGLKATDNSGITRAFDQHALAGVLSQAGRRGKLVRMQASAWLPGYLIGPFRYEGVRSDDPNDAISHEDRRDLRGARVLAAWINHFDAREQNTMDSWISSDAEVPDSSPGHVRHFYLDTSDSFGSLWDWDEISRRLGKSYLLDWGYMGADFVTLGAIERPWERAQKTPGGLFGYFHYRDFNPDAWKNEYPNPAFSSADEHDNAWMTRILSRLDRDDIDVLVSLGKFTRPLDATFLAEVLERRLDRIVTRYFAYLSPLADPRLEPGDKLCLTDLFRRRTLSSRGGPAPLQGTPSFAYQALLGAAGQKRELPVEVHDAGEVCLVLPHLSPEGGVKSDDPSRYVVVGIDNGQARHALGVHLYDLGPKSGFRVVGLERPELDLTELLEAVP